MFFSSPSIDLKIILILLCISFAIAIGVYFKTKKITIGLFVFSALANLGIYLNSGSRIFGIYNLKFIVIWVVAYWPLLNLVWLIFLFINSVKFRKCLKKVFH